MLLFVYAGGHITHNGTTATRLRSSRVLVSSNNRCCLVASPWAVLPEPALQFHP